MAKIRLFIDHPLAQGQGVALTPDQAHYLGSVMRQGPGDALLVFNGRDGEWLARADMEVLDPATGADSPKK